MYLYYEIISLKKTHCIQYCKTKQKIGLYPSNCNDKSEVCGSICRFTLIILIRVKQLRQVYQRQNRDRNNTGQELGQAAKQSEFQKARESTVKVLLK